MSILLRIAERALNRPLLIHPDKAPLILGVLSGRIPVDQAAVEAWREAAQARIDLLPPDAQAVMRGPVPEASRFFGSRIDADEAGRETVLPYRRTKEGVALIPVIGSLINRGAWLGSYSGETSYEGLKFQIGHAAADPKTTAIVLDIESPGGEAVGAFEAADAVRAAAKQKPVVAVVNGMAASAAYAIASAATRIVTTQTGVAGSIGVVLLHGDFSRALDQKGITPTLIFAGAHKVDGNPFEPLSDAVTADLQAEVNQFYDLFVATVAAGRRGMSQKSIRATEARTFIGADAVTIGLADEVGTFEGVLADLTRASGRTSTSLTRSTRMSETKSAPDANSGTVTKADHDKAVADARAAGAAEERARIKSILALEEAKGREKAALAIAMTGASVEQAKAVLEVSPKEQAEAPKPEKKGERAADQPLGMVVDQPDASAAKSGWSKATDRANRSRGFAQ